MFDFNQLRGLESNQRPPGSEPGVTYQQQLPRITFVNTPRHCLVRGEGFEPPSPGSKPGSLPLADPRSRLKECPVGVEPTSPAWKAGTSAARPRARSGRRGSRTLKAGYPRSGWLDCFQNSCHRPLACPSENAKAAVAGIEPANVLARSSSGISGMIL